MTELRCCAAWWLKATQNNTRIFIFNLDTLSLILYVEQYISTKPEGILLVKFTAPQCWVVKRYQTRHNLPTKRGRSSPAALFHYGREEANPVLHCNYAHFTTPRHCWQQQEWGQLASWEEQKSVINIYLDQWAVRVDPSSQSLIREGDKVSLK